MGQNPPTATHYTKGIVKVGTPKDGAALPDWTVTDDGLGLLTGTLKFFYDYTTGKAVEGGLAVPARGDRHPYDERLVCHDVKTTYGSNDIAYCDANYVGLKQDPSGIEYTLNCPTEEDPIQLHPKFNLEKDKEGSFKAIEKMAESPDWKTRYNTKVCKTKDNKGDEFVAFAVSPDNVTNDLVGVKSYKVPRPTMSVTFHTANQTIMFDCVRSVGKQFKKVPYGPDWSDVSKENRSWLFTSVSVTEYAGIFKCQTEYMLSGMGTDGKGKPWNKLIYEEGGK